MSNYWKKKLDELNKSTGKSSSSPTKTTTKATTKTTTKTTTTSSDYWKNKLTELEKEQKKKKEEAIAPITVTAPTKSTLEQALDHNASLDGPPMLDLTKKDDDEKKDNRTWFQKGAFEDGVTADTVVKAGQGTATDAATDIGAGFLGWGEKFVDWLMGLAPYALEAQRYDAMGVTGAASVAETILGSDTSIHEKNEEIIKQAHEEAEEFIKKDLYDEEAVAKKIVSRLGAAAYTANITQSGGFVTPEQHAFAQQMAKESEQYIDNEMEADSVLGDKSDALMQSAGQLGATALVSAIPGVPWWAATGAASWGGELENALNNGATLNEANVSGFISAGAEILTEKISGGIKLPGIGNTLDDALTSTLAANISSKFWRSAAKLGIDLFGEGTEEWVSQDISTFGQWLTYQNEEDLWELLTSEEAMDAKIEAFLGGAALGGSGSVSQSVVAKMNGVDYTTGLTKNEQAVVDKVFNDAVAEAEKTGKISANKKTEIYNEVLERMDKGDIETDIIEEVLGGEGYKTYKTTIDSEDAQIKELEDQLKELENAPNTVGNSKKFDSLQSKLDELKNNSTRNQLKAQLTKDVYEMTKGDRLRESFFERVRAEQKFEADLTQYEGRAREVIRKVMDSKLVDNTNKSHDFWDWVAKMSSDLDTDISLATNEEILEMVKAEHEAEGLEFDASKFEGQTIDGYASKNGIVMNAASKRALNFIVGHEITHKFEKSKHYDKLQQLLFEYAKGEYESRYNERAAQYGNKFAANEKFKSKVDQEVTGDLVGDYIFNDKGFIDHLTKDRNVFMRMWDEVKYMAKIATAGSEQAKALEKAKREFERAYRENVKSDSNLKFSLENGSNRKYNKRSRYNEAETLFKIWENGSAPVGEVKKFNRNGKARYYEKTENGCIELSRSQYNERTGVDVEKNYGRAEREISEAFDYDASTQRGIVGDHDSHRNPGGNVSVFGQALREEFPNDSTRGVPSAIGHDSRTDIEQSEYNEEASEESDASFITFSNDYQAIRNFMKEGDTGDSDVQYSLSDSDGKQLSKGQQDYFKDSKMRDENGNLKVMYHGSQNAGFHVFDSSMSDDDTSLFFVDRNDVAASYSGTSETYEAKTIRTAEDMNNFLAEIGYDQYEAVEKDSKFELLENNEHVAWSDTAQGIYEEFCWYEGVGEGDANYKVYLNLKNPLVVDAKGKNWNNVSREFSQDVYNRYKSLTDSEKTALAELADWGEYSTFKDEILSMASAKANGKYHDTDLASAYEKLGGANANLYDAFSIAQDNFTEESLREFAVKQMNTRDYAKRAKEQGYDGVIFKNIVDNGGYSNGSEGASTVAIAFDSNQIKSVANEKPTADPDIRYSLSAETDKSYLDAVNRGDMEIVRKMVDDVAKDAGLIRAYHGTGRADRVGTVFLPERATSGPMAFFTDNREIAENYAKSKKDTSLAYDEEYADYYSQFRVNQNGKSIKVQDLWSSLPFAEKQRLKEAGKHITWDEDMVNIVWDDDATHGLGNWDAYTLNLHKGNAIEALIDSWLESGELYGNEGDFIQVLELAGIKGVEYRDPDARHEKVYDTFLDIQNPFDTANVDGGFADGFEEWYSQQPEGKYDRDNAAADMWDKNSQTTEMFLERLRDDIENNTTYAWTSIPDSMTDYLKYLGHDGIRDTGGKFGGDGHSVWIPFTSEQVKSAEPVTYDDNGNVIPLSERFDPSKKDIRWSISNIGEKPRDTGGYKVYAKDILLDKGNTQENIAPTPKAIAPIAENAAVTQTEKQALFPDNLAPIQGELEKLYAEQELLYAEMENALDVGSADDVERLAIEYDALAAKIRDMEAEDTERVGTLDDSNVPPEIDAPYPGDPSDPIKAADPFIDRDWNAVGRDRKAKAFMTENPEFKQFFQEEALVMLGDYGDSQKGERWYNDQLHYESGGEKGFGGQKRFTSDDIAYMLDSWRMSWDDIEQGLIAIAEDNDKVNNAPAKRIEFMLNQRLMNGYTDFHTKKQVPPNQAYLDMLHERAAYSQANAQADESFNSFMETADRYAPAENIAPMPNKIAPIAAVNPQDSVGAAPYGFDPITQLQYEYGNLPDGEKPVREDSMPKSTTGKDKVSLTARTVKGAAATPDELIDLLHKETVGGRFSYIPIKNSDTVQKAYDEIVKKGWEAARGEWEAKVRRGEVSAELTATGSLLLNNAAKAGDRNAWLSVLHDYQLMGTNAGQAVQAMRILKTLTPDDSLYMIERSVDQMVEDMKLGAQIVIDENLKQSYLDAKTDSERDAARKALAENVARQIPSTAMDKWTALRYLNMLGNLRTQGRNILGNLGMSVTSGIKNSVATGIEWIAEKASGGKFHRTKSLFVGKDLLNAAKNDFDNVKSVALNGGKFNDSLAANLQFQQEVQDARKIFKFAPLEKYRRATNWAMDTGDIVFSKAAYSRALARYLKANGITETDFSKIDQQTMDEARTYAVEEAQETTFRDNNWLSSWVSKIGRRKDTPKIGKLVSEGVMPFRKTPANILLRAEEYSPLGIVNATVKSIQAAKGNATGADVVNSWAKALTGTGLFALGMWLNNSGALSGGPDEDEEKEWFEDQYGWQNYSIQIGDYNFTIDFLSPAAMPLLMGAQLNELRQNGGVELKDLETALLSIADPMIEMSMLQGVNDTLDNIRYAESNMGQFLVNASVSYLTQGLTNSLLGQVERSFDGQRMSTYVDKDSDLPAWLQKALGKTSAKTPGLDYQQIPYINAWGETENIAPLPALMENALSPSYINQGISDALYEELNRLNDAQSDINVYPQTPDKTVTFDDAYGNRHENYNLSAEEYVELAQLQGQTQKKLVEEILSADKYSGLTDQEKAKAVQLAYQYAREYSRQEVLGADGFSTKWMAEAGGDIVNAIISHTNEEMTFAYNYPEKYSFFKENGMYEPYAAADEDGKRAYNWAYDNPGKYTMSKAISDDYMTFYGYKQEISDIKKNHVGDGEKEVVTDHIFNDLDLDYGQKIILYRSMYTSKADKEKYNADIVSYLDSRDDISYEEMVTILEELGMKLKNGYVTWD